MCARIGEGRWDRGGSRVGLCFARGTRGAFDLQTGIVEAPEQGRVAVFPVRVEGGEVEVCLDGNPEA